MTAQSLKGGERGELSSRTFSTFEMSKLPSPVLIFILHSNVHFRITVPALHIYRLVCQLMLFASSFYCQFYSF
jgi:hypothetical protein